MQNNPIILALDKANLTEAKTLLESLKSKNNNQLPIGLVKLGLEFFSANGIEGVKTIKTLIGTREIFLDLKLFDIPTTVYKTVYHLVKKLNIAMLTVHIMGGKEMMQQAVKAAQDATNAKSNKKTKVPIILGVTILTSMDNISEIGIERAIEDQVSTLAKLADESEVQGIVCSPHEVKSIKQALPHITTVVPGIRSSTEHADQKRVSSYKQAIENGADYLVIGREVTQANDPAQKAQEIWQIIKEYQRNNPKEIV